MIFLRTIRALILLWLMAGWPGLQAQPKVSGRISGGFQAPTSMDDRGRRHVLKGASADPRGNNVYELTEPRVTSLNADDSPEMFIEAPRCFYDMKANLASSDTTLSVRTADGRFSISGVGWRWDPAAANLTISNQVVAFVQKSALATNLAANASASTHVPVRITASAFEQLGDTASFIGSVLVQDGTNRLTSDRLNLQFVKPGGVQKIEAVGNMEMIQGETQVQGGRAVYDLRENIIRIEETPRWKSGEREGSADLLVLDRAEETLLAEGKVYMKLPLTNVASLAATTTNSTPRNRPLEVFSDKFRFQEANSNRMAEAFYENNVRVVHPDAAISCMALTVSFDAGNRAQKIRAERNVKIESDGSQAFGDAAEYDMAAEKIVLSGNPHWSVQESKGSSRVLVFYPKTKEVLALHDVAMTLPGQSVGSMFAVNVRTNQPAATNDPIVIRSDTFSRGTNVAVFFENVLISDAKGKLSCGMVTVVSAGTNQVQRILAEDHVRIEQQGFAATGARADYDVATGLVHLTGDPELVSEGKSLRAEGFVIDRNKNTFSVAPGKYRIQMQMKSKSTPPPNNAP